MVLPYQCTYVHNIWPYFLLSFTNPKKKNNQQIHTRDQRNFAACVCLFPVSFAIRVVFFISLAFSTLWIKWMLVSHGFFRRKKKRLFIFHLLNAMDFRLMCEYTPYREMFVFDNMFYFFFILSFVKHWFVGWYNMKKKILCKLCGNKYCMDLISADLCHSIFLFIFFFNDRKKNNNLKLLPFPYKHTRRFILCVM